MTAPPEKRHRSETEATSSSYSYRLPTDASVSDFGVVQVAAVRISTAGRRGASTLQELPTMLVAELDGALHWWRKAPRGFIYVKLDETFRGSRILKVSNATIDAVAVATLCNDGTYLVCLYNPRTLQLACKLAVQHEPHDVCITPSGDVVLVSRDLVQVYAVKPGEGMEFSEPVAHRWSPSPVLRVVLADGCLVAVDASGMLHVIDPSGFGSVANGVKELPKALAWSRKSATDLFHVVKRLAGAKLHLLDACAHGSTLVILALQDARQILSCFNLRTGKLIRSDLELIDSACPPGAQEPGTDVVAEQQRELLLQVGGISFAGPDLLACVVPLGVALVSLQTGDVRRWMDPSWCVPGAMPTALGGYSGCAPSLQELRDLSAQLRTDDYPELAVRAADGDETVVVAACGSTAAPVLFSSSAALSTSQPQTKPAPTPVVGRPKATAPQQSSRMNLEAPQRATIETTLGSVEVELFPNETPLAVHNFAVLAERGFYNGLTFHRVIKGFMVQGGCPRGNGTSGGSAFDDKPFEDEITKRSMEQYSLCMANRGPCTNESQFFITTAATPWLQGKHTIFGTVTAGHDVVQAIEQTPVGSNDKPLKAVLMLKVTTSCSQTNGG